MGSFSDDQYKCLFRQSGSLEIEGGLSSTSFSGEERQLKACSLLHTHVRPNNPWSMVPDYQDGTCPDVVEQRGNKDGKPT
ncbi:hypothetical protein Tco_1043000 [Tanacetum coccineum]|uniref:Uncharacterized protein n=1 Tax=Tanacetum coccineum TaxID=301880 RepID=A0ABQ5GM17_9ASTR